MEDGNAMEMMERLEIKELAKEKARKIVMIVDIIFIITMNIIFQDYFKEESVARVISLVIAIIIMTMLFSVFLMVGLQRRIQIREINKRSEEYVETYLSKEDDVEVIPIDAKSYREFVFGLHHKGKFYASIASDDEVEIWFQYHNETEKRFFEKIDKANFKSYWLAETEDV